MHMRSTKELKLSAASDNQVSVHLNYECVMLCIFMDCNCFTLFVNQILNAAKQFNTHNIELSFTNPINMNVGNPKGFHSLCIEMNIVFPFLGIACYPAIPPSQPS